MSKGKLQLELHFASRFPDHQETGWRSREFWKCFAMNRSNIFFDSLDDESLENIWQILLRRKPYIIHEHSSTIYALACYIEKTYGNGRAFEIFESSGETIEPYMRKKIANVLNCKVVHRYGLAEAGVIAYELDSTPDGMRFLESECWPEQRQLSEHNELVITTLRNRLMPLIRYTIGDEIVLGRDSLGFFFKDIVGRVHDLVSIGGQPYATHHIMDIMDHRVGHIQEFQIDVSTDPHTLRLVIEPGIEHALARDKIDAIWPSGFQIQFISHEQLIKVGYRNKFRHVVGT